MFLLLLVWFWVWIFTETVHAIKPRRLFCYVWILVVKTNATSTSSWFGDSSDFGSTIFVEEEVLGFDLLRLHQLKFCTSITDCLSVTFFTINFFYMLRVIKVTACCFCISHDRSARERSFNLCQPLLDFGDRFSNQLLKCLDVWLFREALSLDVSLQSFMKLVQVLMFGSQVELSNCDRVVETCTVDINVLSAPVGMVKVLNRPNHVIDGILGESTRLRMSFKARKNRTYVEFRRSYVRQGCTIINVRLQR